MPRQLDIQGVLLAALLLAGAAALVNAQGKLPNGMACRPAAAGSCHADTVMHRVATRKQTATVGRSTHHAEPNSMTRCMRNATSHLNSDHGLTAAAPAARWPDRLQASQPQAVALKWECPPLIRSACTQSPLRFQVAGSVVGGAQRHRCVAHGHSNTEATSRAQPRSTASHLAPRHACFTQPIAPERILLRRPSTTECDPQARGVRMPGAKHLPQSGLPLACTCAPLLVTSLSRCTSMLGARPPGRLPHIR